MYYSLETILKPFFYQVYFTGCTHGKDEEKPMDVSSAYRNELPSHIKKFIATEQHLAHDEDELPLEVFYYNMRFWSF